MALTAEQTTQATQLSNGLPWIYPGASDTDFWGQYFSGSGPSLTPAEQASGISIGPMTASPMPTPAPAPQPQVLPGVNDIGYWPEEREGYVPPGAPVQYQSELIRSLREASPGFGTNNPGVTMLANPANSKTVIDFKRAPPPAPFFPPGPPVGPPLPPAPTPAPPPSGGGGDGGGGPGGPPVVGPVIIGPGPSLPVEPSPDPAPAPDPDVPDYTDDLWPPVEEDPVETFPVPDPTPPDVRDLPPLPPEDDVATTFPVPDPAPPNVVDLPPLLPDDELEIPDYTDDLGTPIYDEIPKGEIDVKTGVTDAYQAARDALVNADTVTQISDAEDLEIPPFDEAVFELIDTPPRVDAGTQETQADASAPVDDVITPDYTEDLWPAIDEIDTPDYTQDLWPAVDEVATPDYTDDLWPAIDDLTAQDMFEMTLFDLMAQELLTGGGGGGGRSNNFNIVSYE